MNRENLWQFGRFAVVGAANTLLTIAIYALLLHLGVHYVIAWAIAFSAGVAQSYLLNRYWTFALPGFSVETLVRYVAVQLLAFGVSTGLLVLAVEELSFDKLVAQLAILPVVALINFSLVRSWALAPARQADQGPARGAAA